MFKVKVNNNVDPGWDEPRIQAITLSIFALIWSFLEIIYSEMGLFIGTVSVSSGEWSRYNYPLRKETISDIAIYAYCGMKAFFI